MIGRRSVPKALRDALRAAIDQGWTVEQTGSKHIRWIPPNPDRAIVFSPSTPGEYRSVPNVLAKLKRSGLKL